MIVDRDKLNANIIPTTTVRVLGTPFQTSVSRPVFVSYTIQLSVTSALLGSAVREVELRCDGANPPLTVVASTRNQLSGVIATNLQKVQLSFIVPKGYFVNLVSVSATGTGTVTIVAQTEIIL